MEISKEEYYGVPEYEEDIISVDLGTEGSCSASLINNYTSSIDLSDATISINSYEEGRDLTLTYNDKSIRVGESISDLTIQVEVMADMLHELAAAGKFDLDGFDINRRVEQKRMLKRLSNE